MSSEMITKIMILASMIAATLLTRFLPFLFFPPGKKTPPYMEYLSTTLPYASIGLLVVYCFREIQFTSSPYGLPELITLVVIIIIHSWKGNSLLSIGAGTALYMVLVQQVF